MESAHALQVDRQMLIAHVKALEGERHPFLSRKRLDAALEYVRSRWQSYGLAVASDEFSYIGERFVNLIARPHTKYSPSLSSQAFGAGACPSGPRFIIGAHVDTVPGSPGADDNASGVASLLEISRIIARQPAPPPVEFVAFTLEELGMVGSAHYATMLRRAKIGVLGMLSLEMLGFTESQGRQNYPWFLRNRFPAIGNYLGLAGNRRSRSLLEMVARSMRSIEGLPIETLILPGNGWAFPEARLSDHSPFWDRGYPALLLTDTAFFRNPHYHQPSDTIETLDLAFLEKATQGLLAAIGTLASSEFEVRGAE